MASLQFDPKDIAPMLQNLGIGGSPDNAPQPEAAAPAAPAPTGPPAPLPPVPAQAGFSAWSSDPQNQKKVADGVTQPGQPLVPTAAAAQFSGVAPMASAPAPNPLPQDQAELRRLQTTGSGASQIKNPWLRTIARIGDAAGTILAPGIMAATPGSTVHNWTLQNMQQGRVANDQSNLQAAALLADTQSQIAQRTAAANRSDSQSDAAAPFVMTKEQAEAIHQPALAGTQSTMRDYSRLLTGAGANQTKITTTGMNNDTSTQNATANNLVKTSIADNNNTTSTNNNAATNAARAAMANRIVMRRMGTPSAPSSSGPGQPSPLVQAIIEGRSPPPNIRMKDGQALMQQVTAADPTYDSSRYNTYQAMQKEATSGKTGQMINSLNTIQEHLGRAQKNMPSNTGNATFNSVKNMTSEAFGGNPTGKYEVDATGIAGEWSKLVAGGIASDAEQKHVMELLSPNASPQKMNDNLAEVKAMTDGKLAGITKQLASAHLDVTGNPINSIPGQPAGNVARPGGTISVTAPDGSTHPFATRAQANTFKRLAGIK